MPGTPAPSRTHYKRGSKSWSAKCKTERQDTDLDANAAHAPKKIDSQKQEQGVKVLSLCDLSGIMVQPWAKAGHQCLIVDIQHPKPHQFAPNIFARPDDILTSEFGTDWDIVFAFPPCTHLSLSGARWWKQKGPQALAEGLALFDRCIAVAEAASAPYMVENPVGRIPNFRRKWDHTFNPCEYGAYVDPPMDMYRKRTCLWTGNGFKMPPKKAVLPLLASKMSSYSPSPDRSRLRALTPRGFAQAVFEANS